MNNYISHFQLFKSQNMKKILFLTISLVFLLSSCATYDKAQTLNSHNNTTEVVLTKKNFKVIGKVEGKSEAKYFFGIADQPKKSLIAEAKANMLSNAKITGSSKAIINENVEIIYSAFAIFGTCRVTVSGYIVEFTE